MTTLAPEVGGAPASIFQHTLDVYDLMDEAATECPTPEGPRRVWEGHMTKLVTGQPLNLPIPYYTDITRVLRETRSAYQIKRGGGSAPSRWVLLQRPTLEVFTAWETSSGSRRRTSKVALLEQRIDDLVGRIGALEDAFQEFVDAVIKKGE